MNPQERNRWKNELLGHVLAAFARHAPLRDVLIFKGARILNLRLGEELRQSLDIDSNLDVSFAKSHALVEQQAYLEREIREALARFFQAQDPVRYQLDKVRVSRNPPRREHPHGWTGLPVTINVTDLKFARTRGLPTIEVDVAASETLGPAAVSTLMVGNDTVRAYTLERIAGEKLRAFLESLPAYEVKIDPQRRSGKPRVKDLYDLTRILRACPLHDEEFWLSAGAEFRIACTSRFVDCQDISTFGEGLENTRYLYAHDQTLPKDIAFDEAWETIRSVVALFAKHNIVPISSPLSHPTDTSP